ncbi:MAG TPA: S9 family peptidase [Anaeromyxobacteraceae bacterium]|nr:S9 family peptidase [Anaeromyxobacteraceae bacterium]
MRKLRPEAAIAVLALVLVAPVAPALAADTAPPPIIPREVLFGNPEKTSPTISPDGKRLAWLAPDEKDVLQVWVRTVGQEDAKKVTADRKRGIRQYTWAHDDRTLLYLQDADGDENYHVYGVDLVNGNVRDLTPFQGVRAEIANVNQKTRDRILVTLNLRDRRLMDVHEVNLVTGAVTLVAENPGDVVGWDSTDDLTVKVAQAMRPDGSTEVRVRGSATAPWRTLVTAPFGENLNVLDLTANGTAVILVSSLGANTSRVVLKDLETGSEAVIAENPSVDAGGFLVNPATHEVQAVDFPAGRQAWLVVDPLVRDDFEGIRKLSDGDFAVTSRSRDDKTWLVAFTEDRGPVRYYTWDRTAKKGTFMFVQQPKLEGLPLAQMSAVSFPARDGLTLNGYLTLPVGVRQANLPLVLFVHGGPWARDTWGYNPYAQWLANRGYAVMQVNFRGSTGYGKKFLNAGNKQWGKAMHTDLLDAVDWTVKKGWVDPTRVAVMGGSYGGYATLAGLAFTPDAFKCGVDIVGPSNLFTLLQSIPPYWAPLISQFHQRMGDPKTDEALLRAASPLFSADRIKAPLLIGQGANDPRVKQAESEQIVAAMEAKGLPVTYVLYPDEGHGFARPPNRIDFNARAEAFLAACLGGRAEPLPEGGKVPGSTAVVKVVEARK